MGQGGEATRTPGTARRETGGRQRGESQTRAQATLSSLSLRCRALKSGFSLGSPMLNHENSATQVEQQNQRRAKRCLGKGGLEVCKMTYLFLNFCLCCLFQALPSRPFPSGRLLSATALSFHLPPAAVSPSGALATSPYHRSETMGDPILPSSLSLPHQFAGGTRPKGKLVYGVAIGEPWRGGGGVERVLVARTAGGSMRDAFFFGDESVSFMSSPPFLFADADGSAVSEKAFKVACSLVRSDNDEVRAVASRAGSSLGEAGRRRRLPRRGDAPGAGEDDIGLLRPPSAGGPPCRLSLPAFPAPGITVPNAAPRLNSLRLRPLP